MSSDPAGGEEPTYFATMVAKRKQVALSLDKPLVDELLSLHLEELLDPIQAQLAAVA